jgi:predicted AlkP superfamily phosphohydrolase/phosphomutase
MHARVEPENSKWRGVSAAIFGGAVGAVWGALYDATAAYMIVLVIAHALTVTFVAAAVSVVGRKLRAVSDSSSGIILGASIGMVWMAPIVLFVLDFRYLDIRVDAVGLLVVAVVGLISMTLGAVALGLAGSRRLLRVVAAIAFSLAAPLLSLLLLGAPLAPSVTLEVRLGSPPVPADTEQQRRVMVLGVDGASWNLLLPMLREGKLPHLKSLMNRGRYGVLESVLSDSGDIASPVVWTSIFTGTLPAQHGIRDWMVSDSRNRRRKALWNILNGQGKRAIVVNVPGTFPPEVVEGAMISGFPMPGVVKPVSTRLQLASGRVYTTHPERFRVVPSTLLVLSDQGPNRQGVRSDSPVLSFELPIVETIETKHGKLRDRAYNLRVENLFLELVERRGYFQARLLDRYYASLVDTVDDGKVDYDELLLFHERDDARPFAVLAEGTWSEWQTLRYRGAEFELKLRVNELSRERVEIYATPLFQSSSEPVVPFTYPLNLGRQLSARMGPYVVEGAGWTMYEDEPLRDTLYEHIADIGAQHAEASTALLDSITDWSLFVHLFTESDRVQHPFWRYHEPEAYGDVDGAAVALEGDKVEAMMETIDSRIGDLLSYADDDTLIAVVSDHGFRAGPETGRGEHSMQGIYVFSGSGIDNGELNLELPIDELPHASVVDVTPTLLYFMGYPTAQDFDGRALIELADETQRSRLSLEPIASFETEAGAHAGRFLDESTIEQLRSLGYVK